MMTPSIALKFLQEALLTPGSRFLAFQRSGDHSVSLTMDSTDPFAERLMRVAKVASIVHEEVTVEIQMLSIEAVLQEGARILPTVLSNIPGYDFAFQKNELPGLGLYSVTFSKIHHEDISPFEGVYNTVMAAVS